MPAVERYDDGLIAFDHPPGFAFAVDAQGNEAVRAITGHRQRASHRVEQISVVVSNDARRLTHPSMTGAWVAGPRPGVRTVVSTGGWEQVRSHCWLVNQTAQSIEEFRNICQRPGVWYATVMWQTFDQTTVIDVDQFDQVLASIRFDLEKLRQPSEAAERRAHVAERRRAALVRDFSRWAASLHRAKAPHSAPHIDVDVAPLPEPGPGEAVYRDEMVLFVHPRDFVVRRQPAQGHLHAIQAKRGRGKAQETFQLAFHGTFRPHTIFPDLAAERERIAGKVVDWSTLPGRRGPRIHPLSEHGDSIIADSLEHFWLPQWPAVADPVEWRQRCIRPETMVASLTWVRMGAAIALVDAERVLASIRVPGLQRLAALAERAALAEAARWLKTDDAADQSAPPVDADILQPGRPCDVGYDHSQFLVFDHPDIFDEVPDYRDVHHEQGFLRREHAVHFFTIAEGGDAVLIVDIGPYRADPGDQRVVSVCMHTISGDLWCGGLEDGLQCKLVVAAGWHRLTFAQRLNDDESADFRLFVEAIAAPVPSAILLADRELKPPKNLVET